MKYYFIQSPLRNNKFLLSAILFLLLFISSNFSSASHMVGSEISYHCTGTPGIFNVTLKIYKDCSGVPICSNCPTGPLSPTCAKSINIVGAGGACYGTNFGSQNLTVITVVSAFDVIQLCAAQTTICNNCGLRTPGSFSPGIEVYVFSGQINLNAIPASCCMVSLGFGECCRNSSNTVLVNSSSLNYYTEAILNRCVTPCNSTPSFTNEPVVVACAGQDFTYNIGAIDPDGDSLSYAFGASLTGANTPAPYVSPYSPNLPFSYVGFPITCPPALPPLCITLDAITGDLRFRPQGTYVSNLVIEVKQWKNIAGVPTLVGINRRDIQFYSITCAANNPPVLRTYDASGTLTTPQPNYAYSVCAGQQLCFTVGAWDNASTTDTTDISWNAPSYLVSNGATFVKAYNNSTRSTLGPRLDSMRFCWTPPTSAAQNLPYYFVVNARDRACPVSGRTSHSFSIIVRRIPTAFITKTNRNCGYYDFGYSLTNSVSLNNAYAQFQIETAPGSNVFTSYNNTAVSNHRFLQGGMHRIKLRLTTVTPPMPNGCPNDNIFDSILVTMPVKVSMQDTSVCFGKSVKLQAHGSWGVPFGLGYRYTFYSGDISSTTIIRALNPDSNITLTPATAGIHNYKVVITDLNGCTDSAAFTITSGVTASPEIIHPALISACYNSGMIALPNIVSTNKPGQVTWVWTYPLNPSAINGNQVIAANLLNQPATPPSNAAGNFINVTVSDSSGCSVKDSLIIAIFPKPIINAGPRRHFCDYAGNFNITPGTQLYTPNGGVMAANELWFGNGIFKPNAGQNYYAFNPQAPGVRKDTNIITYKFIVNFPLSNTVVFNPVLSGYTAPSPTGGCQASDTVIFDVIETPKLEAGLADPVCKLSDSIYLDAYMVGRSTTSYNPLFSYWYIGAPDEAYRPAISRGRVFVPKHPIIERYTKQYVLVYADTSTTCRVADTTFIEVKESPDAVVITGQKTALRTDTSYTYSVLSQANVSYMWTLINGTINTGQGTSSVHVTWTNSGAGSIKVEVTNLQNCSDLNQMNVFIGSTGINELTQLQALQIFPNPNNGNFVISVGILKAGNYSVQIFNALGDIVHMITADFKSGKNDMEIKLPRASGVYFLRISDHKSQLVKRFVID
ncbi:MAG: T9SS type A sorting domain-containing protein [Bacteroidota bacterium]|nr:T9SS type A sorting domain-containing protein [Bacteroidota bacterium]